MSIIQNFFPRRHLDHFWAALDEARLQADKIDPVVMQIRQDTRRILEENHLSSRVALAFDRKK